jgi:hypothetical protein
MGVDDSLNAAWISDKKAIVCSGNKNRVIKAIVRIVLPTG